ncbi:MAG: MBL fold metallo-hydrolase [bacterium]|nr:MBL fold metallo-hydrolase [bacterium]
MSRQKITPAELPATLHAITSDVYQVHIPLPFLLNRVNVYLVRGERGWTILDTGLHHPPALEVWHGVFDALAITPNQIEQIVLTHIHPDHYGLAGWLQAFAPDADVRLSPVERDQARLYWRENGDWISAIRAQLHQHDTPDDLIHAIIDGIDHTRQMTFPHPVRETVIDPGETVRIGDRHCQAIHAPGHADGQLIFFDEGDGLLFSGDHVLNKITPNIGLWSTGDPHPLTRYLASLRALRDLPVRLALPGHKTLIENWSGRIDELLAHHAARLTHIQDAAAKRRGHGGISGYETARALFDFERLTTHEMRFAIMEALAHLEYLCAHGELQREISGGQVRYQSI